MTATFYGIDTETHLISETPKKGQKRGVVIGSPVPRLVCLSVWNPVTKVAELIGRADPDDALLNRIVSLVEDDDAFLVAHNMAFDFWVLAAYLVEHGRMDCVRTMLEAVDAGRFICTQVREKLLLNRKGYLSFHPVERGVPRTSLDACTKRYTGSGVSGKTGEDAWRLRYAELETTPTRDWPASAREYAILDARYCMDLYGYQAALANELDYLNDAGEIPTELLEVAASISLAHISQGGIHAAPPRVRELAAHLREELDAAHERLVPTGLVTRSVARKTGRVKYTKNKKVVAERLKRALGDAVEYTAPSSKFPDGQIKDGADELRKATNDPDLLALAEIAEVEKLAGTYLPILSVASKVPVHVSYQPFMETSRTSATAPNVQNQPRKGGVRECFIPCPFDQGGQWVLISCDYSAQELVCFAQNAIDLGIGSGMGIAINKGLDLHCVMGAEIATLESGYIVNYDDFVSVLKGKAQAYRDLTRKTTQDYRQLAKAANFGLPGGMGAESFVDFALASYGVRITLEQSKLLKEAHRAAWPEMKPYFDFVNRTKEGGDFLVEHLPGGMIRRTDKYTASANSRFQGRAAQMSKTALWFVTQALLDESSPLWGCRGYAFVHDEILIAAPVDKAHRAAMELSRLMVRAGELICPDVVSKAPPACAYCWYKAMEEEYDSAGNLVPWVPNAQDKDGNWLLIKNGTLQEGQRWSDPLEVKLGWTQHLPYPRGDK